MAGLLICAEKCNQIIRLLGHILALLLSTPFVWFMPCIFFPKYKITKWTPAWVFIGDFSILVFPLVPKLQACLSEMNE